MGRLALVATLLTGGALTGCNNVASTEDEDVDANEAALEEGEAAKTAKDRPDFAKDRRPHGPRAHGPGRPGPEMLFFAALHELELSDAQRTTIEGALESLRPERDGGFDHEAMKERSQAFADAIRSNTVDAAKIDAEHTKHFKPVEHRERMVAAMQTLHDTLTHDQRVQLVDGIKARAAEMAEKFEGKVREKDGPHERGPRGRGDFVDMLLHGIEIDDAQRAKITAALEAAKVGPEGGKPQMTDLERQALRADMKQKMEAALEAFQKDVFDAATALPEPPDVFKKGPPKMGAAFAVIVPLLDQDQRDALADRVEAGPPHRGKFGHKMRGPKEAD